MGVQLTHMDGVQPARAIRVLHHLAVRIIGQHERDSGSESGRDVEVRPPAPSWPLLGTPSSVTD